MTDNQKATCEKMVLVYLMLLLAFLSGCQSMPVQTNQYKPVIPNCVKFIETRWAINSKAVRYEY